MGRNGESKSQKRNGSVGMVDLGKLPIQIWLDPKEMRYLKAAALKHTRPVAWLVKQEALKAAFDICAASGFCDENWDVRPEFLSPAGHVPKFMSPHVVSSDLKKGGGA